MIYKKLMLFALLLLLLPATASAYSFEVDGIYYDVNSTNATVTYGTTDYNSYSGSVTIPTTVTYNGSTYSVTSIGRYAFASSTSLTSVTIPESVTNIGDYAFQNCTSLTSVNLPNSVTSVGEMVFSGCILDNITIGENLTSVYDLHWTYGWGLRGMTRINFYFNSHFDGCDVKSLTWNAIDCPIPEIDWEAIYETDGHMIEPHYIIDPLFNGDNLENVTIGEQVKTIPYEFAYNSQITEIKIPHSVTSIGEYAFANCAHLKTIDWQAENCDGDVINYGLFGTSGYAFYNDTVSRINIGSGVKSICYGMFFYCHVDTIVCHAILPPEIGEYYDGGPFDDSSYTDAVLCVPEGSLNAYRNAPKWSEFQNIITIGGGGGIIPGDVDGDQQVSIADVTAIVDLLLLGNATAGDYPAADVDGDGAISIADVTSILDIIL